MPRGIPDEVDVDLRVRRERAQPIARLLDERDAEGARRRGHRELDGDRIGRDVDRVHEAEGDDVDPDFRVDDTRELAADGFFSEGHDAPTMPLATPRRLIHVKAAEPRRIESPPVTYLTLKLIHVACVIVTYALFTLRGAWMITGSPRFAARWTRVVPHVNDTVLLAAAISLAVLSGQYPPHAPWVGAKIAGLVVYIVLGAIALRYGRTRRTRVIAFVLAQCAFLYIVLVALTRQALP